MAHAEALSKLALDCIQKPGGAYLWRQHVGMMSFVIPA